MGVRDLITIGEAGQLKALESFLGAD